MRVALASLESFYDHSLALDYLVTYASLRPALADALEFELFVEGLQRFFKIHESH